MQHITHDRVDLTQFIVPDYFPDLIKGAQIITGVGHYNIPNSTLSIHLNVEERGGAFSFSKGKEMVYINSCCLAAKDSKYLFGVIKDYFKKHKLGKPAVPIDPTWVYTVPVKRSILTKEEIILCNHLARAIFYALFKARNPHAATTWTLN